MKNQKLVLSMLAFASVSVANAAKKPNVIFILADDMGYGDVSYYDANQKIKTPNLDAMAREGVVFKDAHTSSSVSTPTRYGILTGRYNWRSTLKAQVLSGYSNTLIPEDRSTMGNMFQKAGYNTAYIGKWHLGWDWVLKQGATGAARFDKKTWSDNIDYTQKVKNGPTTRGFDYSFGICGSLDMPPYVYIENDVPTDTDPVMPAKTAKGRLGPTGHDLVLSQVLVDIVRKTDVYIKDKAKENKPFFLYLPFTAPHTPIVPTKEFLGKSGLDSRYADFVLMVDVMVGEVLRSIDDAGVRENTLVVFTTDNGCSPAANIPGLIAKGHSPNSIWRGHKADLFEGGHRVPCIVRYPDGFKHHDVEQTVCLNDFYATFAEMVGYKIADTEAEDSFSLLSVLKSTKEIAPVREATVHHSIDGEFTIRKGDWKLLMSASSGGWSEPKARQPESWKHLPAVQLYNLKDDPSETTNLQDKHPEIVKELEALLTKYIKDGRSTPGVVQSNDGPFPWKQLHWMK